MMVNGMYKSIVKGFTLFTLVLMSVVLTYKIWNFKPNLVNIESSITKSSTALSPKNLDNIHGAFLPYQVVSYTNNRIYGTTNKDILLEYINSLSNKKITAISTKQLNMNYMPKGMKERFLILDFASDFPLSMYLSDILDSTFKGDVDETFNRLIVDSYSKDNLVLYAITDHQTMVAIEMDASSNNFNEFVEHSEKSMESYTGIIANEQSTDEKTSIYVPEYPSETKRYSYLADTINVDDINKAVLGDKNSIIERKDKKDSKTYNSNTGIVKVKNKATYKFNNLSEVNHAKPRPLEHLISSFNFISEHGGFTDDYRYFDIKSSDNAISYQMFFKGYPVFHENHLTEIDIVWGDKDVYEYKRGLYSTSVAVPSTKDIAKLPSAEEVRYKLASNQEYHFDQVSNMMIGFNMVYSDQDTIQSTLSFEPEWYVKYNNEWRLYQDGRLV